MNQLLRVHGFALVVAMVFAFAPANVMAEQWLVKDGKPQAEIIIAEKPKRAADMGAEELQTYIRKISGATLPIVTKPSGDLPVRIYVGESEYTKDIAFPKSDDGPYRIVSGDNWLALIGQDWDFRPVGMWARGRQDWLKNLHPKWREQTNSFWHNPIASRIYRDYNGINATFDPDAPRDTSGGRTGIWEFDHRGSQNAVYDYLRTLGVRWYMPGELGEVVPKQDRIALPDGDMTAKPDFRWRFANFARYGRDDQDSIVWSMRLGSNNFYGELLSHGMRDVTSAQEMKDKYPQYYALYNGTRNTVRSKANQCLRSPGLFEETLRYCRTMFDEHDVKMISVMPSDGYTSACQCELCDGWATIERGRDGWISDYVWDWTNRVAKELYKSHPDRFVSNFAYGTYKLPPTKIDKLSPNVVVGIVGGRQSVDDDPKTRARLNELRTQWLAKTDNKVIIWINYPQMRRGEYRPCYWPRITAKSIADTKGQSQGDFSWLPENLGLDTPGVNHLSAYTYLRFLWDADQDIDAVLEEYYTSFYGPAASYMKQFIELCEANFVELTDDKDVVARALKLFDSAKASVQPDSVYGKRVALVDAYLEGMRNRQKQLDADRGPVPTVSYISRDKGIWYDARDTLKMDGKIEEDFWFNIPGACSGSLRDTETGGDTVYPTTFKVVWANNALHFAIHCQDAPVNPVNIATEKSGDPAIFFGDTIELLIETDSHSYYQIVINPAGAVVDIDRKAPKSQWYSWNSKAEVATHIGKDSWSVEVKLPVDAESDDPLHHIIGNMPRSNMPWHINVCRQRVRGHDVLLSSWAPTGKKAFHHVMKFGKLQSR